MVYIAKETDEYDILTTVLIKHYKPAIRESADLTESEKYNVDLRMSAAASIYLATVNAMIQYAIDNHLGSIPMVYVSDDNEVPEGAYKMFVIDNPDLGDNKEITIGEKLPGVLTCFCTIVDNEPGMEFHYGDEELCHLKISLGGSMFLMDHHMADEKEITDPKKLEIWNLLKDASGKAIGDFYKHYYHMNDNKEEE